MMHRFIIVLALSLAAPAVAQTSTPSAAVSDFKSYCMDTRADPAAAFAAADHGGWTIDTVDSAGFAGVSGSSEGREINRGTTAFRALTAGRTTSGTSTYDKCVIVAQEPFEVAANDLVQVMPVRVGSQSNQQWTWHYVYLDGVARSLDHMSTQDAVRAGQSHNPTINVILLRVDGGEMLIYSLANY